MNTDFVSRCQKLRHAMVGASIDTALITGEADLRYLTGCIQRNQAVFDVSEGKTKMLQPGEAEKR